MPGLYVKPRWWHPIIQKLAASGFGSWLLADNLHRLDRPFLRLSGGKHTLTTWLAGLPVVVLTTTGAKSGLPRRLPLAALEDAGKIILIASDFGSPRHPAWYHNLIAHSQATVEIAGKQVPCQACEAQGEARARYWAMAGKMYPGYKKYEKKAGKRQIPVMVLTLEE